MLMQLKLINNKLLLVINQFLILKKIIPPSNQSINFQWKLIIMEKLLNYLMATFIQVKLSITNLLTSSSFKTILL
jgi:hypothetical protein